MTLSDAIGRLDVLSDDATLFVERIDGRFVPESRVVVLEFTDQDLKRPVQTVALERAPGCEYFLEVSIAREVVDGWRENHGGKLPTHDQAIEFITYYAEHDAYPNSFFA